MFTYNPYFIMMFEQYSKNRYTRLEERVLKWLLECACTPSSHWSRCDYKRLPFLIYELKRVPVTLIKGSPKTTFAAGGIGTVQAPMCHVAAFLWDFNTDYRIMKNGHSDVFRKLVPMKKNLQTDHNYTLFVRKSLPTPLSPRDFYQNSAWKRLDDKRIVIFAYDRDDGSYEEECSKLPDKFRNQEAVRASAHSIYILEEFENSEGVKTKLSFISVINSRGYLPKWLVRTRRASTLSIIQETMEYFEQKNISLIFRGEKNSHSGYKHVIANNHARGVTGVSESTLNLYLSNQDKAHTENAQSYTQARGSSREYCEYSENPESVVSQLVFEEGASPPQNDDPVPTATSFAMYLKQREEWNLANDNPDDIIVVNFNELSEKSLQLQQKAVPSNQKSSLLPFFNNYYVASWFQGFSRIFSSPRQYDAR